MEKEKLTNTLQLERQLVFYKIMKYPVPSEAEYFLFDEKAKVDAVHIQRLGNFEKSKDFSRPVENPYMEEYRTFINKYAWLYKSLPFIKSIYLCNSITFNALKEDSDIDIFIVTKKWALRRARFFSEFYFRLFFLKRGLRSHKRKKFCLSFYVTEESQNLYPIMLPQNDIYFIYWMAHLVPLYQEEFYNIYKDNRRLTSVLPYFPGKSTINIGIPTTYGRSWWKKTTEFRLGWPRWKLIELCLKMLRLPIVIYKKNKLKSKGRWIIINKHMLKFHEDSRKRVHLLYEVYVKSYKTK